MLAETSCQTQAKKILDVITDYLLLSRCILIWVKIFIHIAFLQF